MEALRATVTHAGAVRFEGRTLAEAAGAASLGGRFPQENGGREPPPKTNLVSRQRRVAAQFDAFMQRTSETGHWVVSAFLSKAHHVLSQPLRLAVAFGEQAL